MQEAKTNLEEVQVEADAKQMEFKHDKRIFNVSQELTSKGSNASELLKQHPLGNGGHRGQCRLTRQPECAHSGQWQALWTHRQ
ncbi:MAG: hypothetical protein U5L96_04170 [Owenweeksia sp.]|nr:hypothetical protein [Owenweeksia sp.]